VCVERDCPDILCNSGYVLFFFKYHLAFDFMDTSQKIKRDVYVLDSLFFCKKQKQQKINKK